MREIKFRAWNCVRKCYIYNVEHEYDDDLCCFFDALDDSGLIAEQYTGLKDVNGKEIYEGDILAASSKIGGKLITDYLKVDWREDYAGFFCGETPLYACLSEWDNDIKYPQTFPKIVSNVHENPELLEEQHDTRTD